MKFYRKKEREFSELELAAMEWVTKVDRGLSAKEQQDLDKWLAASELNVATFREYQEDWEELDRIAGLGSYCQQSADPNLFARKDFKPVDYFFLRNFRTIGTVAAVLLVALTGFFAFEINRGDQSDDKISKDQIVLKRIEIMQLEDGSSVQLNHGTQIEVNYSNDERYIALLCGEANFNVAKDADRPFVVESSGVKLRAVGTEFNVRLNHEGVDVIVTEGIVALDSNMMTDEYDDVETEVFINANQRAIVQKDVETTSLQIQDIDHSEIEKELLWKPVLIDFEYVPLKKIVAEFNKRNPVNMVIVDETINESEISSVFWSDNVSGFIRLLEANFGIRAEWGGDDTVYLFRKG